MNIILDNDRLRKPRRLFLNWYRTTPEGESLQICEASFIHTLQKGTYNERILQVESFTPEHCHGKDSSARVIFFSLDPPEIANGQIRVQGEMQALPFESDSMDKVILPHIIEFESGPRAILEECIRILRPEGELIVLAFNPWHLKTIKLMFSFTNNQYENTAMSRTLLERWLHQMKCDTSLSAGFQLGPPAKLIAGQTRLGRLRAGFAAVYAITAKKKRLSPVAIIPRVDTGFPSIFTSCLPETSLIRKR